MPLPKGTRYRWKTFPSGKKVRLAFRGGSAKAGTGTVIEAKSSTGAVHTPAEFAAERKGRRKHRLAFR